MPICQRANIDGRDATVPAVRRAVPLAAYDEALRVELKALPRRTQAAFAAACAERLYPAYDAFQRASGRDDGGLVRRALDAAWEGARTGVVREADPRSVVRRCVALIPAVENDKSLGAHADDAIASVAYALQAAAGLDDEAAGWAAQRAMDSLDTLLLSGEIDSTLPDAEQRVWEHPLVTAEIRRRDEDLQRLMGATDWEATLETVRADASGVSVVPLERFDREQ